MSVIRVSHKSRYFSLSNSAVEDSGISFKAKGILAYLMSKPEDWKVYLSNISKLGPDGETAVRAGINELITAGYINRSCLRGKDGKFLGYDYVVSEYPEAANGSENPYAENPISDNSLTGSRILLKNDTTNDVPNKSYSIERDATEDEYRAAGMEYQEHIQSIEAQAKRLGFPIEPADLDRIDLLMADYSYEKLLAAMKATEDRPKSARCWAYVTAILKNSKNVKPDEKPKAERYGIPDLW